MNRNDTGMAKYFAAPLSERLNEQVCFGNYIHDINGYELFGYQETMREAADRIEELEAEVESLNRSLEHFVEDQKRLKALGATFR